MIGFQELGVISHNAGVELPARRTDTVKMNERQESSKRAFYKSMFLPSSRSGSSILTSCSTVPPVSVL